VSAPSLPPPPRSVVPTPLIHLATTRTPCPVLISLGAISSVNAGILAVFSDFAKWFYLVIGCSRCCLRSPRQAPPHAPPCFTSAVIAMSRCHQRFASLLGPARALSPRGKRVERFFFRAQSISPVHPLGLGHTPTFSQHIRARAHTVTAWALLRAVRQSWPDFLLCLVLALQCLHSFLCNTAKTTHSLTHTMSNPSLCLH